MTHTLIKKKLLAELELSNRPGDLKIYSFVKDEILNGDEAAADEFMLSSDGGYTNGQLSRIKNISNYLKSKSKASCRVQAF